VLATGVDFMRPKGLDYNLVPRTYIPVQTIILATEPISEKISQDMMRRNISFFDASIIMNYGRLIPDNMHPGYNRLTFGGAGAVAQIQVAADVANIENEMRILFPQLNFYGIGIEKVWGGRCDMTRTMFPILINPREDLYHAGGFSGQGLIAATLYGASIAERILGKDTGKFEILEQLNPSPYARNILVAWMQAAKDLIPSVYKEYKEAGVERQFRAKCLAINKSTSPN
jgi:gamma-glutamylputrescine oxidase